MGSVTFQTTTSRKTQNSGIGSYKIGIQRQPYDPACVVADVL